MATDRGLCDKGGGDGGKIEKDWDKDELSFGFNIHVNQEPVSKSVDKQKLVELKQPFGDAANTTKSKATTCAPKGQTCQSLTDTKISNTRSSEYTDNLRNIKLNELAVVKSLVHRIKINEIKINEIEISECKQALHKQVPVIRFDAWPFCHSHRLWITL